jgi:hypothetical protein
LIYCRATVGSRPRFSASPVVPLSPAPSAFPSRLVTISDSNRGLFATAALPAGTTIARFEGPIVPWRDVPAAEVCHAVLLQGDDWLVPTSDARYVNHSCDPNCTVDDSLAIVTTRPVADGEQLTFSYDTLSMAEFMAAPPCYFWDARWSFDCRCGAPACVGRIDRYRILRYGNDTPVTPAAKLRLALSPGKGRGVFATAPIAAGEIFERAPVIVSPDTEWAHLEKTVLFHFSFCWGSNLEHAAIALGYASLYNHSFAPNARYRLQLDDHLIHFVALRAIAPGEEITVNYNGDPADREPVWFDVKET